MGRHPYKKRNQAVAITRPTTVEVQRFIPTKYETPVMTLKNFPSSIVNGVTREGGLYSLTLKSINCAKYVENNDNMRRIFKKRRLEIPKVSHLNRNDLLEKLRKDVQKEKETKVDLKKEENDKITALNKEWDSLLNSVLDLSEFNDKLLQDIESEGKRFRFIEKAYSITNDVTIPDLRVEKIEQVKDLDATEYYQAPLQVVDTDEKTVSNEIEQDDGEVAVTPDVVGDLATYQDYAVPETKLNDSYTQ
ncbi:hypothetical protein CANMA_005027 [Candida margitis]|uniref:uncharacterized protein n=1 Tax=Candida margitis TaxID=1775924 RepID=UPI00222688FE|nr:uncharacterized protein CANMA_005027 [Candida margitis]KAI5953002.1 hypothetical protein CANMA_005027 [Candida margitis]